MTALPRRRMLKGLLALAGAAALRPGASQPHWPAQALRIIVVYPPGGLSDGVARSLAERLALQLGADWQLNDNWYLNAAVWKIDIETTARISVDGAQAARVDVAIDPLVFMLGAAYSF